MTSLTTFFLNSLDCDKIVYQQIKDMDNESDSIARKLFITEHASTSGRKQLKRRPIREVDEDLPSVVGVVCGIMVVMVALVSLPLMMVDCEGGIMKRMEHITNYS